MRPARFCRLQGRFVILTRSFVMTQMYHEAFRGRWEKKTTPASASRDYANAIVKTAARPGLRNLGVILGTTKIASGRIS